jgi:hypothetical protein
MRSIVDVVVNVQGTMKVATPDDGSGLRYHRVVGKDLHTRTFVANIAGMIRRDPDHSQNLIFAGFASVAVK